MIDNISKHELNTVTMLNFNFRDVMAFSQKKFCKWRASDDNNNKLMIILIIEHLTQMLINLFIS